MTYLLPSLALGFDCLNTLCYAGDYPGRPSGPSTIYGGAFRYFTLNGVYTVRFLEDTTTPITVRR